MTVKEETVIRRLPSFVWPFLASTDMLARWNTNIRRIFPKTSGPFRPHFEFDVTLLVKNQEREYIGEVVEFVEHRRIVFKLCSKTDPSIPPSIESITLTPLVKGTRIERVTETVGNEKTISWWARLLGRLFGSLGRPRSDQTLKRLARLVEQKL